VLLLAGIVVLLLTLWNLRTGEADLAAWLGHCGVDVTRRENGIFFWLAIVLQSLIAIGLIVAGAIFLYYGLG